MMKQSRKLNILSRGIGVDFLLELSIVSDGKEMPCVGYGLKKSYWLRWGNVQKCTEFMNCNSFMCLNTAQQWYKTDYSKFFANHALLQSTIH